MVWRMHSRRHSDPGPHFPSRAVFECEGDCEGSRGRTEEGPRRGATGGVHRFGVNPRGVVVLRPLSSVSSRGWGKHVEHRHGRRCADDAVGTNCGCLVCRVRAFGGCRRESPTKLGLSAGGVGVVVRGVR